MTSPQAWGGDRISDLGFASVRYSVTSPCLWAGHKLYPLHSLTINIILLNLSQIKQSNILYENGIHSVFAYVSCVSHSGCLQSSASIPFIIKLISNKAIKYIVLALVSFDTNISKCVTTKLHIKC